MIAKRSEVLKGVQANMQGVVDLTLILRSFNANRHPQVQAPNVGNQFLNWKNSEKNWCVPTFWGTLFCKVKKLFLFGCFGLLCVRRIEVAVGARNASEVCFIAWQFRCRQGQVFSKFRHASTCFDMPQMCNLCAVCPVAGTGGVCRESKGWRNGRRARVRLLNSDRCAGSHQL